MTETRFDRPARHGAVGGDHGRSLGHGNLPGSEPFCGPAPLKLTPTRRAQVPHPVGLAVRRHQTAALTDLHRDHRHGVRAPRAATYHGKRLDPSAVQPALTSGFTMCRVNPRGFSYAMAFPSSCANPSSVRADRVPTQEPKVPTGPRLGSAARRGRLAALQSTSARLTTASWRAVLQGHGRGGALDPAAAAGETLPSTTAVMRLLSKLTLPA